MALDRCAPRADAERGWGGDAPILWRIWGFLPSSLDALPGLVPAGCWGAEQRSGARRGAKGARGGEGGHRTPWGMQVAAEMSPLPLSIAPVTPQMPPVPGDQTILEASSPLCLQPHPFIEPRSPCHGWLGFPAASALLCPGREPSRGHRGAGGDIKPLLGAGLSPDWGAEMSPPGPCFMLPVLKEQWSSLVQCPLPFLPCFVPAWWPPPRGAVTPLSPPRAVTLPLL